ncbi:MAG: tyrosine-type recombinase/integrase [Treponema sp.]|uniref:tyrosine-type recombinase/integrase n=1 Tax=Treponema sp. TaxID=166 RepID=UPI0025CD7753|nr:tyrosine-type recombinase/integrase [Treponema sp.]MBQ9281241.1 tyrosine-type recombinase/integrase [Treponema sp.]
MNAETINRIKVRMENELSPSQMKNLENVLTEILYETSANGALPRRSKKNLVKQFLTAKRIEGCSKRTEEYYNSVLAFYKKNIGCDICLADTNKIREYLTDYQKINNCSNVTLDTVRRILSSFYKWLEEEDFILKSPMKRIHRIKAPIVIKPAFSDEQVETIRKSASKSKRNIAIIDILLSSGIRVSELVRLNRSSINLNTRTCTVFGKGAKQRLTYFDVRTKIELENYLKTRKDKNNALFVCSRRKSKNGSYTRLTVNSIEKMIRDIGIKTNIENVHPHRFRRTLATNAIDKGMPIEQVQFLLGHTKIDTTLRYANVQQANVRYSHQKFIC